MRFSKSTANCWTILCGRGAWPEEVEGGALGPGGWEGLEQPSPGDWGQEPYCSRALVLRAGSSGRKFLYSSTSFSMDSSWLCSLFRSPGSVSRMWLVSCWVWWVRKRLKPRSQP